MTDYLSAPLGLDRKPARSRATPVVVLGLSAGLLGAALALSVALVSSRDNRAKPLEQARTLETAGVRPVDQSIQAKSVQDLPTQTNPAGRSEQIVSIIDGKTGAREELRIPGTSVFIPGDNPQRQ
jgi:hypothetical protein